ncbi:hypothetical protein [Mesorhizobium sp.]|uniref:hypothetical protein n=1 Tax=Mesorhizobium sp. TaxID=1871066 RepID=UPI000FE40566|nr:hypothetical protein [Mesorhizobium sp.]RWK08598.1 MAG: hypothetical protein EOR42_04925 [Mesorhizobium sp.]
MHFPRFLVGMLATSFVVAMWAEIAGSGWEALGWAVLAMIILQAGYFGLIICLICTQRPERAEAIRISANSTPSA